MSLIVILDSATADPSRLRSKASTSISVSAFGPAGATRALAEYVIADDDPFVFGNNEKKMRSDLVFVSPVGTSISSRLTVRATGSKRGQVTVTILVSERDIEGKRLGADFETGIILSIT